MKIIDLIETDFVNYKKTCMTIMFPYCTFKCNKDAGKIVCQNYQSKDNELVDMPVDELVERYINNPMTEALVMQGFEPFDSYYDMCDLLSRFTQACNDDIVIYTGYKEDEIIDKVDHICNIVNNNDVIIKYGRFIPDSNSVFDNVLGVTLQSDNQYAKLVKKRE